MRDNAQREFIDIAAHELRTPIQPILGLSEVAMARNKDDNLKEILEIITKNSKRLYRLTEGVLDVTRIDSKILKLNKEAIDIFSVIEAVVIDYRNEMQNYHRDIELIWNKDKLTSLVHLISVNCVEVRGDQSRLVQVISNLVSNAIKFTEDKGTITIDMEADFESKVLTIKIIDTGRGMRSRYLSKVILEIFDQIRTRDWSWAISVQESCRQRMEELYGVKTISKVKVLHLVSVYHYTATNMILRIM